MLMLGDQGYAIQRYVLARLTETIQVKAGKPRGLRFYTDRDADITVEHILPQNKDADAAKPFADVVDIEAYIYQLGNLTLLHRVDNSYNNDGDFEYKRDTFREPDQFQLTRFLGGSPPGNVAKRLRDLHKKWGSPTSWNPGAVEKRSDQMMSLADEIWDLKPGR